MRYSLASLALVALAAANPVPGGVTSAISPSTTASSSCESTYDGTFEIEVLNASTTSKRALEKKSTALTLTLKDGVLHDAKGRTGYIASNNQFQFDDPPQAGAIYTSGWSVCSNGTLALGDEAIFYECLSGTFYNLYDESTGEQCSKIYIEVIGSDDTGSATASQQSDGQVTASSAAAVSQISDGQIQATTAAEPITQISDGQIQAATSTAAAPVTQISDGQIQAPTTTVAAVTQISDGQIQAPTSTAATIITTASVVSQISDGQIQAPTGSGNVTVTSASATVSAYTGAAALPTLRSELFGLAAAGLMAVAML